MNCNYFYFKIDPKTCIHNWPDQKKIQIISYFYKLHLFVKPNYLSGALFIIWHFYQSSFLYSKLKWAPEPKRKARRPLLLSLQDHQLNHFQPSSSSEWIISRKLNKITLARKLENSAKSLAICGEKSIQMIRPSTMPATKRTTKNTPRRKKTMNRNLERSGANRANPQRKQRNQKASPKSEQFHSSSIQRSTNKNDLLTLSFKKNTLIHEFNIQNYMKEKGLNKISESNQWQIDRINSVRVLISQFL